MRPENGKTLLSALLVITFGTFTVPQHIYLGYQCLVVRAYVPKPKYCFKCQGFEHVCSNCMKPEVCGQCGLKKHNCEECKNSKGPNCGGDQLYCLKSKEEKAFYQ